MGFNSGFKGLTKPQKGQWGEGVIKMIKTPVFKQYFVKKKDMTLTYRRNVINLSWCLSEQTNHLLTLSFRKCSEVSAREKQRDTHTHVHTHTHTHTHIHTYIFHT